LLGSAVVSARRDVADATAAGDGPGLDAATDALDALEIEAASVEEVGQAVLDVDGGIIDWRAVRAGLRSDITASEACVLAVPVAS
jgi:hypothetical protein